jgi:hypothetical protein
MIALTRDNPQAVIQSAFKRGWVWAVADKHDVQQSDLPNLTLESDAIVDALAWGSRMQQREYDVACMAHHDRDPHYDGECGPAMEHMLNINRCLVPDCAPPKEVEFKFDDSALQSIAEAMRDDEVEEAGRGNWKGCNGVGADFHSCIVEINLTNIPREMTREVDGEQVFKTVLRHVQVAYAQQGLLFLFRVNGKDYLTGKALEGRAQTEFSFVTRSNGWIGLAIVGQNQSCNSTIWLRLLATYSPGDYIRQWFTLISHELGHNCGSGHISGDPVMHPSIRQNSPWLFRPQSGFWNYLVRQFGGDKVDIPDGGPGEPPTPPEPPPASVQEQLDAHEFRLDLHEMLLRRLLEEASA